MHISSVNSHFLKTFVLACFVFASNFFYFSVDKVNAQSNSQSSQKSIYCTLMPKLSVLASRECGLSNVENSIFQGLSKNENDNVVIASALPREIKVAGASLDVPFLRDITKFISGISQSKISNINKNGIYNSGSINVLSATIVPKILPKISQIELLTLKQYKDFTLSPYTASAATEIANQNKSVPFLDQVSLSVYCKIASFYGSLNESRCNYDVLSAAATSSSVAKTYSTTPATTVSVSKVTENNIENKATTSVQTIPGITSQIPVYINQYITKYIPVVGPAGKDGKDGRDGKDGAQGQAGFGGYIYQSQPSTPWATQNLIGISTIGYLRGTTIEYAKLSYGTADNLSLTNSTFSGSVFSGSSIFNNGLVSLGDSTLATTTVSGLTISQNGLSLTSSSPATTTNTLYALGSNLMWNGSAVGSGVAGVSTSTFGFITATSSVSTSTFAGAISVSGVSSLATTTISSLNINNLVDGLGASGVSGQLLSSTGTSTRWINTPTATGTLISGTQNNSTIYWNGSNWTENTNFLSNLTSSTSTGNFNVLGISSLATTTALGFTATRNGLILASSTPATTTNTLYALGSNLMWNGSTVGSGVAGTSTFGFITATSSIDNSSFAGSISVAGSADLASTRALDLTVTNKTTLANASSTSLTATNLYSTSANLVNIISSNIFSTVLDAVTATFSALTGGDITATSSLTSNGTLAVTGTSTLATTTATNLSVSGATSLANATSSNFFASILNAVTATINTLTGGNITATSSLTSNGTLAVTGTSTLATTTISNLTANNININGLTTQNVTSGSITATSSLTSNGTLAVTGTSTLATTTVTNLSVSGQTTLGNASSSALTATNLYATSANVTATTTTTGLAATLANIVTGIFNNLTASIANITTATIASLTGGNATIGTLTATSTADIKTLTASTTAISGTLSVNGTSTLATTTATNLSVSGQTTLGNASSSALTATNLYATSLNLTNATSSNLFSSILNAITSTFSTITSGTVTATSSLTSNGTLAVTGTSTLATTTATNLSVSGATSLANATSTNFFSSILNAITATVNTLTGGNITATSSLTSNGTLAVTGTSTLATTTVTNLSVSGQTTLGNASSSALTATNLYATSANVTATTTTTGLAATLADIVTGIFNNLTASIANITTATIASLTGGNATIGTLTATSTADIKTLTASTTAISGTLSVTGTSTLATTTITNLTADNININGITTQNITSGTLTATSSLTSNGTLAVTGTSTLATTTSTNLSVSGATSLANATSTNFFSSILNAITATVNTLTGGNITATSSLTSNGTLAVTGTSTLATTTVTNLSVSGQTTLGNASSSALTATNLYATSANVTATTTTTGLAATLADIVTGIFNNLTASIANITTATIASLTGGNATIGTLTATSTADIKTLTASTTAISGTLSVTGTSTLATTTVTDLSVSGATSLANATSTNFFSSILNAITATVNTLTGGNITATSSLTSNGTLAVAGTSTLATTTVTNLSVSGQTTLGNTSASDLTVTNLNVTNITSPSIITGSIVATSSLVVSATSTFATTTMAKLTVTGDLVSASSTVTGTSTSQSLSSNFADIVTAIINTITASVANITTATISALTGGSATFGTITATSSLMSQGTLSALGTTTLNILDMNSTKIINVPTPVNQNDAANRGYVDSFFQGISWQAPVTSFATSSAPGSPNVGDRYILSSGATGFGSCTLNQIAEWSGSAWTCTTPSAGWSVYINSLSSNYNYNSSSTSWVSLGSTINHQTLVGIQGGNGGEAYHLNLSDYNALHTGNPQLAALQTIGAPSFAGLTITSSSTRADAFNVTGTSTMTGNLVVSGDISSASSNITNFTSSNIFATALNAVSSTINSLIGGSITATSSLSSNGTFSVTGTSTLATTTATNLTASTFTNSGSAYFSNLTSGSIPFIGNSGLLSQSNNQLFWDSGNGRLGVGSNVPQSTLDVNGDIRSATGNYYTGASGSGNLSGLRLVTFGVNTVGNALIVNDINGAKYAFGTGGYDLTFYKHKADASDWYKSFVIEGDAANNYPTGYSFYTGNAVRSVVIDASGNLGVGSTTPSAKLVVAGNAVITGTSILATTTISNLTANNLNINGLTTQNVTAGAITATSSLTSNGTLTVTGTSTLATTTISNLTANNLNINGLTTQNVTAGTITATSSLTSNGTLAVTGTSTLATTTATNLSVSGQTTLGNASSSALTATNLYATSANVTATTTTTGLAATLANIVTGIFNNLTASIANITTATIASLTGGNATIGTLTATSTADIKTLTASTTAISGTLSVTGTSTLATTTVTDLSVSGQTTLGNASSSALTATNLYATSLNLTNATSSNLFSSILNAITSTFSTITSGTVTATSSLTSNGTLAVTGTSTLATTTSTNLSVSGATSLANATSTNFFSSILNAITATVNTLTGGNITATSSLTSNGTLAVTGTSTLATTTATNLSTSGALNASSTLAVTGQSTFYNTLNLLADILPTTDITRSLGSNALRFLNLFTQNIFASSSVITNATSTNSFATNLSATNATITNASTTNTTHSGNTYFSGLTAGSVPFIGANGLLSQNNGNFFWDNANGRLGIGTTTPSSALTLSGALEFGNSNIAPVGSGIFQGLNYLQVRSGTAGFLVNNNANNVTNLSVLNNGNVGVGTATPGSKLEVKGGSTVTSLTDWNSLSNTMFTTANPSVRLGVGYMAADIPAIQAFDTTNAARNLSINPNGGNVGIGTTTPGALFDVSGNMGNVQVASDGAHLQFTRGNVNYIKTTTASSSFRFVVNGNADTVGAMSIDSAGNVGIGTTTPFAKLDVYKNIGAIPDNSSSLNISDINNWNNTSALSVSRTQNGNSSLGYGVKVDLTTSGTPAGETLYGLYSDVYTSAGASSNNYGLYVNRGLSYFGGNVGVGTTSPDDMFEVRSNNAGIATAAFYNSTGANTFKVLENGNVGIGTTTPSGLLSIQGVANFTTATTTFTSTGGINLTNGCFAVNGVCVTGGGGSGSGTVGAGTTGQFPFYAANGTTLTATSTLFLSTTNGFIGIGTTSPTQALDVNGKIAINGTQTIYDANALGLFTGTMYIGNGGASLSHTTGSEGWYNTAVGSGALLSNTTGYQNSAQGVNALRSNITGYDNSALGVGALPFNTTGFRNSAIGYQAGYGDGTLPDYRSVIDNNMVFIGAFASRSASVASTTVLTNGIAIGYDSKVFASNQVVLGNDSITTTLLKGNIGIGTTTPSYKLDVAGLGHFTGLVDAANFVATSTTATSTFAGGLNVGNGGLVYDYASNITSIPNLNVGATSFDTNAGILSWMDMAVTSAAATGTIESYSAQINGTPILTVYSESDGIGGIRNYGVGIGTTTPTSKLSVVGTSGNSLPIFTVASSTGTSLFNVMPSGNIGIGTSTPNALFDVAGSVGDVQITNDGAHLQFTRGNVNYIKATTVGGGFRFVVNGNADSVNAMTIDSTGNIIAGGSVGIGTSTPATALQTIGDIRVGTSGTNGCLQNFAGTALSGTCSSDQSLKTVTGNVTGILDKFAKLQLVNYRWNDIAANVYHNSTSALNTGFIAQQVETQFPELVSTDTNGYKRLDYTTLGLYGLEATKEIADKTNFITNNSTSTGLLTIGNTGVIGIGNNGVAIGDELLRVSGNVRAQGFIIDSAADIAETFPATEAVDAGTIVAFATSSFAWSPTASSTDIYEMSGIRKAHEDNEVIGIVSTKAGLQLGGTVQNGVPVAFTGRVPVKITKENGEIKRGDYITASKTRDGYGMKLTGEGRAIGIALSDDTNRDTVLVLLQIGDHKLNAQGTNASTTGMLTTGNLDLNANGVAITNIKSLASANGTWSVSEDGRITAKSITTDSVETKSLCVGGVCVTDTQLAQLLSLTNLINASTTADLIAQVSGVSQVSAATSSVSPANASIVLNGNSIVEVNLNATWSDVLGANYNHDGFVDVIYSTSTVDTSVTGTTTIDYFATYISTVAGSLPQTIHKTRAVVVVDPNATSSATSTAQVATPAPTPAPAQAPVATTTPVVDVAPVPAPVVATSTATTTP